MATRETPKVGNSNADGLCLSPNTVTGELTCSICFEIFESPRTLPSCLHTFCEECLFKVFDRADKDFDPVYLCPVCRKSVRRPGYGVSIKNWVKEFPVNHVINSLLTSYKKKQEDNLQTPKGISSEQCTSCDALETTEFCFDCHEFMCQKCIDLHNHFKATRHHKTVSVSGMENLEKQVIELSKCTICSVHHDKMLEFYCKTDKIPLCSVCATVDHRKCLDIITIENLIKETASTEKVKTIMNKLNDIKPKLESHEMMLLKNRESVKEDLRKVIKTISDSTNKAIIKLHELEKKTIENCNVLERQITESLNQNVQSCKTLEPNIGELVDKLEVALKFGSELQVFLEMEKIKTEVDSVFHLTAEKHGVANTYKMAFKEDSVLSKLMSACSIGEAVKETTQSEIKPLTIEEKLESSKQTLWKSIPKAVTPLFSIGTDHGPLAQPATKNRKMEKTRDKGIATTLSSASFGSASFGSMANSFRPPIASGTTASTPISLTFGGLTTSLNSPVFAFNTARFNSPVSGVMPTSFNSPTFGGRAPSFNSTTSGGVAPSFNLPTFGGMTPSFNSTTSGGVAPSFNSASFQGLTASFNSPVSGVMPTSFNSPVSGGMTSTSYSASFGVMAPSFNSPSFGGTPPSFNSFASGVMPASFNPTTFGGIANTSNSYSFGVMAPTFNIPSFGGMPSSFSSSSFSALPPSFSSPSFSGLTPSFSSPVFSAMAAPGTNPFSITTIGNSSLPNQTPVHVTASNETFSVSTTSCAGGRGGTTMPMSTTANNLSGTNKELAAQTSASANILTCNGANADSKVSSSVMSANSSVINGINEPSTVTDNKTFSQKMSASGSGINGINEPSTTADNKDTVLTKISTSGGGIPVSSTDSTGSVLTFSSFASSVLSTIGTNTFSVAASTTVRDSASSTESVSKSKTYRKKVLERSYKKKQESGEQVVSQCQSGTAGKGFDFSLSSSGDGQKDNTNTPGVTNFKFGISENSSSAVPFTNTATTVNTSKTVRPKQTWTPENEQMIDKIFEKVMQLSASVERRSQAANQLTVSDTKLVKKAPSAFVPYVHISELGPVKSKPVGMPSTAEVKKTVSTERTSTKSVASVSQNSILDTPTSDIQDIARRVVKPVKKMLQHPSNNAGLKKGTSLMFDTPTSATKCNARGIKKLVNKMSEHSSNKTEQPFSPSSPTYNDAFPPLTSSVSVPDSMPEHPGASRSTAKPTGNDPVNISKVIYTRPVSLTANVTSSGAVNMTPLTATPLGSLASTTSLQAAKLTLVASTTATPTRSFATTASSVQHAKSTPVTTKTLPALSDSLTSSLAALSLDTNTTEGGFQAKQSRSMPLQGIPTSGTMTEPFKKKRRTEWFPGLVKYTAVPPIHDSRTQLGVWRTGSLVFTCCPHLEKKWKLEIYFDGLNTNLAIPDLTIHKRDIQCLMLTETGLVLRVYQPTDTGVMSRLCLNFKPESQAVMFNLKPLVHKIMNPPTGGGDNTAVTTSLPAFSTDIPTNFSFNTGHNSPFTFSGQTVRSSCDMLTTDNHSAGGGDSS